MVNFITIRGHGENLQGFSLQQAVLDSTGYFGLQQDIWEILVRFAHHGRTSSPLSW